MEDTQRVHECVVVFETPGAGVARGSLHGGAAARRLIVVVTNEASANFNSSYSATVGTTDGKPHSWHGYSFKGDEDSLRLLHALAVGRGISYDGDTFEELAGVEDGPRTRLVALAGHRAS